MNHALETFLILAHSHIFIAQLSDHMEQAARYRQYKQAITNKRKTNLLEAEGRLLSWLYALVNKSAAFSAGTRYLPEPSLIDESGFLFSELL